MKFTIRFLPVLVFLGLSLAKSHAQTNVLSTGHTDLILDYTSTNGLWNLHVGSDTLGTEYDATNVILEVKALARTAVPSDPKFGFLGAAGTTVWLLPQTQNEDLLYLGYGGDGIPAGAFLGDQVVVTLKGVTGPGQFFSYKTDTFGNPVVYFNTADGISTNDAVTVQAGGDAHLNWGFTAAGTYRVVLEASATFLAGNKHASNGPVVYTFQVDPPVELTNEHVDLRVLYDPATTNHLSIVARDEDHLVNYQSNEVNLEVAEAAELSLPEGTPFGNAGDVVWIIPQSQDPSLLYLGLSAEGIPDNTFSGNVTFQLAGVEGPGNLFVWQSDSTGNLTVYFNSADGISAADSHSSIVGSHEHFNWGFTTNGVYRVTFQVSGQLSGQGGLISSPMTSFTFNVLPLPTNAVPAQIQLSGAMATPQGGFAFNVVTASSSSVEIQTTEDFKQWSVLTNLVVAPPSQAVTVPADATKTNKFFRVQSH